MIKSVSINWEALGAEFANGDDCDQRAFLIGMAKELSHWPSSHQKQMQAFSASKGIHDSEKKELETFFGCIWYRD